MSWVRPTAVAGLFYDDDPGVLAPAVDAYVAAATPTAGWTPKAVIAPHAGYVYSGPTAGVAYAALAGCRGAISRVVLAGPAHRVAIRGVGISSASQWASPLGPVEVDRAASDALVERGLAGDGDAAHAPEHSLEVHLPFLQRTLGTFTLVPLVIGHASAEEVAAAYDEVWGGDETLVVVSSDLSHYLDHEAATARDRRTAAAVLDGRVADIAADDACGAVPIRGLLVCVRRRGMEGRLLDLRTSGDTAGDRHRVVGYGAFAFT
jgi:AmmeMemoRadiSam system protein B